MENYDISHIRSKILLVLGNQAVVNIEHCCFYFVFESFLKLINQNSEPTLSEETQDRVPTLSGEPNSRTFPGQICKILDIMSSTIINTACEKIKHSCWFQHFLLNQRKKNCAWLNRDPSPLQT